MENHSYTDIIGNRTAPYINSLVAHGTSLTQMHATAHPSEPNYLALFSGSTHGLRSDACPIYVHASSLASELLAARLTFAGYSDGLPSTGSRVCRSGDYARRHVPWIDFPLPSTVNRPFTSFPSDFTKLPTVSFVIPDVAHDMHDGTVAQGDGWLRVHLAGYVRWAATHHSMLILTFDEDDASAGNRIPTVIVGQDVRRKAVSTPFTHYSALRLVEDFYGLRRLGLSATASLIPLP